MTAFEDRLFVDLRTETVSVWKVGKSGVAELFSAEAETLGNLGSLQSGVLDSLADEIASKKLPVTLVLPNSGSLFKVLTIPVSQGQKAAELLAYEVEQSFPHENSELVWCHTPLWNDEIESHHLVAAMRCSLFENLISGLGVSGVSEVEAIPSVFLELAASSSISDHDIKEGLRHLISLRNTQFFSLSWSAKGGIVRSKSLSGVLSSGLAANAESVEELVIRELKRTQSSVRRTLKPGRCSAISLIASTADVILADHLRSVMNADDQTLFEQVPDDFETLLSAYLRVGSRGSTFKETASNAFSSQYSSWPLWLALILIAAAPFTWVWGNFRVVKAYEMETNAANRSIASNRALSTEREQLMKELDAALKKKESLIREQEQRQSVVSLFKDVQHALIAVGDTWIETLDLALIGDEPGDVFLKLSGKFLVRESNLKQEVRQRALEGAEASLNKLQETLLISDWVDSVVEFKVNYAGMDSGVNVVPFSINLKLGAPFSLIDKDREVLR